MADFLESLELRENNPYSIGSIFLFDEGDVLLDGADPEFKKSLKDRYYTVERGDTLSSIAYRAYGSSKWHWLILKANNISFAFDILPAQTLYIPDLETFKITSNA